MLAARPVNSETKSFAGFAQFSPKPMLWLGFGTSLLFLIVIAIFAEYFMNRLASDEQWVSHSQEVERVLGRLRGDFFAGETARIVYVATGNEIRLGPYFSVAQRVPQDIDLLKGLTSDNASQQNQLENLRGIINRRAGELQELVALKRAHQRDDQQQADLSNLADLSNQAILLIQQMRDQEDSLLRQRQTISAHTYQIVRVILAVAFIVIVVVLALNFHSLWIELGERSLAEASIRRLNGRILQVQDVERRKVARELHDSIGQVFAAMKMNLAMLKEGTTSSPEQRTHFLDEFEKLLDIGISEARTLSHLLHPPLLDELGFNSAAQWLVDGFSQRSKIQVTLDIPSGLPRMTQEIELCLFRVLQESLTNIHRHSGSTSAEIRVEQSPMTVTLTVRDQGSGIPSPVLENFHRRSGSIGVGLAGMRERVNELGGRMELYSDLEGTVLRVSMPVAPVSASATPLTRSFQEKPQAERIHTD